MPSRRIEVAVVGDGPAGSALAQQLTRLGVETVLFGADREWGATYSSWIDDLDAVAGLDEVEIWMHRFDSVAAVFERPMTVERPYGVIDNDRLREALRNRVTHEVRKVSSADETGARIVVDATGWPSGLDGHDGPGSDRRLPDDGRVSWQTAIGVVLEHPPEGSLGRPTVMDFSHPPASDDLAVPTFVYAFPVADGWLVEETVLAGPALEPERLLPRLASRLGRTVEELTAVAVRIERVRIPMGAPVPARPRSDGAPSTVRFGAAAGMIHPATGYSVASSLRAAERVAGAVRECLARPGPVDRAADAVAIADAVWPRDLRRARRLHDFGLDVLLGMDTAEIRAFFQAFFDLPPERWAPYLRIDTPPSELARIMTAVFRRADWPLRRQLLRGNPRSLVAALAP